MHFFWAIPIYFFELFIGYIYPIYFTLEITIKAQMDDPNGDAPYTRE